MPLSYQSNDKDIKYPKHTPSILEAEIRAVKRYADCDKKRSTVCSQTIKRPKNL